MINAERQVEASRTSLEAARQKQDVDAASGQVSIENSRQGVVTAQNTLDSASTRPARSTSSSSGRWSRTDEALVRHAQRDVDDATLRAPVDGTVSAINGTVGEFLSASSGTTALAPGSDAAIPGTDSQSGGSDAAAGGGHRDAGRAAPSSWCSTTSTGCRWCSRSRSRTRPRSRPTRSVTVGFDAIPDLTRNGTVLSVAPSGTAISGDHQLLRDGRAHRGRPAAEGRPDRPGHRRDPAAGQRAQRAQRGGAPAGRRERRSPWSGRTASSGR